MTDTIPRSRLVIAKNASKWIFNFTKIKDYKRAEEVATKYAAIAKCWKLEQCRGSRKLKKLKITTP